MDFVVIFSKKKILKYHIWWKSVQWEQLFHADRRSNGQTLRIQLLIFTILQTRPKYFFLFLPEVFTWSSDRISYTALSPLYRSILPIRLLPSTRQSDPLLFTAGHLLAFHDNRFFKRVYLCCSYAKAGRGICLPPQVQSVVRYNVSGDILLHKEVFYSLMFPQSSIVYLLCRVINELSLLLSVI